MIRIKKIKTWLVPGFCLRGRICSPKGADGDSNHQNDGINSYSVQNLGNVPVKKFAI